MLFVGNAVDNFSSEVEFYKVDSLDFSGAWPSQPLRQNQSRNLDPDLSKSSRPDKVFKYIHI